MRVSINQNSNIKETEIIINCTKVDARVRNLANYIRQYSTSLEGTIEDSTYYVPLDSVLYIDSVDKKTFFYDRYRIFSSPYTLSELEEKLENTLFVRISKNCLVNLAYISSTSPYENHRMQAVMSNGEHLIVARSYRTALVQRLKDYHSEMFHVPYLCQGQELQEQHPGRSLYNVGRIIGFDTIPKRIIALSYENAELLFELGVGDRIIAIAPAECTIEDVQSKYREVMVKIPLITYDDKGVARLSEIAALGPDFVLGNYYSFQTLQNRDKAKKIDDYGIKFYVMESTVPGKANLESMYRDILNLGRIFRIENRTVEFVGNMRRRIAVLSRFAEQSKTVRVFVYDTNESFPGTAMGGTFENSLIAAANGINIFGNISGPYRSVSWEEVARADPEVIVVHRYMDHWNVEEKINILCGRPELCNVAAIRNKRFVDVSLLEVLPGIQNVDAVEKLIRAFHPSAL